VAHRWIGARGERKTGSGRIKRWIWKIAALLVAAAAAGFLVVVSGIMPITASSGHWPITAWFLHFSMQRSVGTHSLGIDVPPLDDPDLALKGAGHYETGCRSCHGSPGMKQPRIAQHMTPSPPYLPPKISEWDPEELFYLVKHGVKFTGMPAWPSQQRDDEVWAMVAFLRKLPKLDEGGYRHLVQGEPAATPPIQSMLGPSAVPSAVVQSCMRCHGSDGIGRGSGAFPMLAGQSSEYLQNALKAYARGERHSGIMQPIAAGLRPETIPDVVRYYAGLSAPSPAPSDENKAGAIARGQAIAERGIPDQRVASCVDCHGPSGQPKNAAYPALAGQHADYLVLQLELFKKGDRGGSPYAHLMRPVATRLKPEQMRDVALYFESLQPPQPQAAEPNSAP
jgi:cytochrome c553